MANDEYKWYKWWPSRSRNSFRWNRLTLEERGLFRELYDIAALRTPIRGQLRDEVGALSDEDLSGTLKLPVGDFRRILGATLREKLIIRDDMQTLVFPDFAAHQRGSPCRPRKDVGTKPAQKRGGTGAELERQSRSRAEVEQSRADKEGEQKKSRAEQTRQGVPAPNTVLAPGSAPKDSACSACPEIEQPNAAVAKLRAAFESKPRTELPFLLAASGLAGPACTALWRKWPERIRPAIGRVLTYAEKEINRGHVVVNLAGLVRAAVEEGWQRKIRPQAGAKED